MRPGRIIAWTLLFLGGVVMVTPIFFMFTTSLKTAARGLSISTLIPREPTLDNYPGVCQDGRFVRWFLNSLADRHHLDPVDVFFDSLVGYTLAKFEFRGRYFVFLAILSTLMIPTEMLVIPWYMMSGKFGWLDTYLGHHVPRHDDGLRHLPDETVLRDRARRFPRAPRASTASTNSRSGGRSPCRW